MISIVLVETTNSGNIGAVARVMKNFNFNSLMLVNPKCRIDDDALAMAKHAKNILHKATIIKKFNDLLELEFDCIIGTTSLLGSDYNVLRTPIKPEQLGSIIKNKKIALVFGREQSGLRNDELARCDFIVTIPTSEKYPAMNISHAVAVILYELAKNRKNIIDGKIKYASGKDKNILLDKVYGIIDSMPFATKSKRQTQKKVWKRLIGKGFLSRRELFAIHGFFKKLGRR